MLSFCLTIFWGFTDVVTQRTSEQFKLHTHGAYVVMGRQQSYANNMRDNGRVEHDESAVVVR